MEETDLKLADGRDLHVYDTGARDAGADGTDALAVFWHHGTPNLGTPPEPLFDAAERLNVRWLGYDRPGYGSSTAWVGRDIASAARDVAAIADAKGIERFAVMGHSGGAAHALACGALLPERVTKVAAISGLAPFDAEGLDWFAGMFRTGEAELRAAAEGRGALLELLAKDEWDPELFTPADHAVLTGSWNWLNSVVGGAMRLEGGVGAMADDDVAGVTPWGFDPAKITVPTLLLHGDEDRCVPSAHSSWLAARMAGAELRISEGDGHISVLRGAEDALAWLRG